MSDQSSSMEKEFQLEALLAQVAELESKLAKYETILRENEIDVDSIPDLSDEEMVCIIQIRKLKDLSDNVTYNDDDSKIFDRMVKALYIIRGKIDPSARKGKKTTKAEVKDLLRIARDG